MLRITFGVFHRSEFRMPNPLTGVRVKIDRAKKHLADLDAAIKAFESRQPYTFIMEVDPNSGCEVYRFRECEGIPVEWGAIVGDCVHNARSSLDLLANALVRENGGTPTNHTAFPIGSDATDFRRRAIKKLNGASAAAIKLVEGLQPYPTGYNPLYRLHRIDIADKHLLLIPVAVAHRDFEVKHFLAGPGVTWSPPGFWHSSQVVDRKFPLKDGDILRSYERVVAPDIEDKTKFHFGFEIAFGEGQIFDGDPVVPTLTQLVDLAEGIIDIFAKQIFGLATW
jgi:hypothetical protein